MTVNRSSHPHHWQLISLFGLIVVLAGLVVLALRPNVKAWDAHANQVLDRVGAPLLENAPPGSNKEVRVKRAVSRAKADMHNVYTIGDTVVTAVSMVFFTVGALTMGFGLLSGARSRIKSLPR